jgi:hypothetical protein
MIYEAESSELEVKDRRQRRNERPRQFEDVRAMK